MVTKLTFNTASGIGDLVKYILFPVMIELLGKLS